MNRLWNPGSRVGIAGLVMIMLAACLQTKTADPQKKPPSSRTEAAPSVANAEPTDMVIYHPYVSNWSVEQLEQSFGESIKKKFPNIRPKFLVGGTPGTAIPELIMAKQAIDIVFVSVGATQTQFLDYNLGYDITPFIQSSKVDLGKFDENSIRQLKELGNGTLFGLPLFETLAATVYNKDLFDKFGVAYPREGITWNEMHELNKRLTLSDGGVQYYGFSAATRDTIGMNQRSAQLFRPGTDEVLVTTDVWKNLINDLVRFYTVPGYNTSSAGSNAANQQKRFFEERTTAMYITSSGLQLQRLAGMNFDFATFPVYPEMPKAGPAPYPTNIYVTSISKHKEQAFQILDYLTSKEFQSFVVQDGTQLTVLKDAEVKRAFGTKSQALQSKNLNALLALQHSPPLASNAYTSVATGAVQNAIVAVVAGEQDINTALRQAEETANKTISERKGK